MPNPLPRSYAALIGGVIRDARVVVEDGQEQLVIELETGAQYSVTSGGPDGVVVSELQAAAVKPTSDAKPNSGDASPNSGDVRKPTVNLQAVAGAVQDILRDF